MKNKYVEIMDSNGVIHVYGSPRIAFYQEGSHCRIYEDGEKYAIASFLNYIYVKFYGHKTEFDPSDEIFKRFGPDASARLNDV